MSDADDLGLSEIEGLLVAIRNANAPAAVKTAAIEGAVMRWIKRDGARTNQ